jgi:hypothetical protein
MGISPTRRGAMRMILNSSIMVIHVVLELFQKKRMFLRQLLNRLRRYLI